MTKISKIRNRITKGNARLRNRTQRAGGPDGPDGPDAYFSIADSTYATGANATDANAANAAGSTNAANAAGSTNAAATATAAGAAAANATATATAANNNNVFTYKTNSNANEFYKTLKLSTNFKPLDCMSFVNEGNSPYVTRKKQLNCIKGQMSIKIINMLENLRKQATDFIKKSFTKQLLSNTQNTNTQKIEDISKEIVDMMISDYIKLYAKAITSSQYQDEIKKIILPKKVNKVNKDNNASTPLLQNTDELSSEYKITQLVNKMIDEFPTDIKKYINVVVNEGKPDSKIINFLIKGTKFVIAAIARLTIGVVAYPLFRIFTSSRIGAALYSIPDKLWNTIIGNNELTDYEALLTLRNDGRYNHRQRYNQIPFRIHAIYRNNTYNEKYKENKKKLTNARRAPIEKQIARRTFLSRLFGKQKTKKNTNTK